MWRIGRSNLITEQWEAKSPSAGPAPLEIVGDPYGEFCGQHSAKMLGNSNLLIYDNGVVCVQDSDDKTTTRTNNEFTRIVEYSIDLDAGQATFVRRHSLNGRFNTLTESRGPVEPVDNGNWLISWGRSDSAVTASTQTLTEVDPAPNSEVLHIRFAGVHTGRRTTRAYPVRFDEYAPVPDPLTVMPRALAPIDSR